MGCCSRRNLAIIVVVAGVLIFGLKWGIDHAEGGPVGLMRAMLTYEKHGTHGRATAEDVVQERGVSFKGTVSIVTGVSRLVDTRF